MGCSIVFKGAVPAGREIVRLMAVACDACVHDGDALPAPQLERVGAGLVACAHLILATVLELSGSEVHQRRLETWTCAAISCAI